MKKICVYACLVLMLGLNIIFAKSALAVQSFQFTTSSLPGTAVGQQYGSSIGFSNSGTGTLAVTYSGSFPPGISATPPSGYTTSSGPGSYSINLLGTPTQGGNFTITVTLSDKYDNTISQNFSLTVANINGLNGNGFSISGVPNPLSYGAVGVPYNVTFGFSYNGLLTPTATFSGLPSGISAGTPTQVSTGSGSSFNYSVALSGTPTTAGSYNVSLNLSDGQINNTYSNILLTIYPAPATPSPTVVTITPTPAPTPTISSGLTAPTANTDPAGTNVSSGGTVYMITPDGQKLPYTSAGAFLSYGFNTWANVVPASPADLSLPTSSSFIPPRDGKIICSDRGIDKGTCYLITDGKKAAFTSEKIFKELGFSFSNDLTGDVSFLPSAPNIDSASQTHRAGVLVNYGGTIYLVGDNGLVGVPDMSVLNSWGYSLADAVNVNIADEALTQVGILQMHTASQLSWSNGISSILNTPVYTPPTNATAVASPTPTPSADYSTYAPVSFELYRSNAPAYLGKTIAVTGMVNSLMPKGGNGGATNYIQVINPFDIAQPQIVFEVDDSSAYSAAVSSLQDKSNPILQFVRVYGIGTASQAFTITTLFGSSKVLIPALKVTRVDKCLHGSMNTTLLTGTSFDDNFTCTTWTTIAP